MTLCNLPRLDQMQSMLQSFTALHCYELRKLFDPQALGTVIVVGNHQVLVDAEPRLKMGVKYYLVEIVAGPFSRFSGSAR